MIFFTVVFWVLVVGISLGFGIVIAIYVPLFIYSLPYVVWLGFKQHIGKYKDVDKGYEGNNNKLFFHTVKCATRVYKSWITHKEPNI